MLRRKRLEPKLIKIRRAYSEPHFIKLLRDNDLVAFLFWIAGMCSIIWMAVWFGWV